MVHGEINLDPKVTSYGTGPDLNNKGTAFFEKSAVTDRLVSRLPSWMEARTKDGTDGSAGLAYSMFNAFAREIEDVEQLVNDTARSLYIGTCDLGEPRLAYFVPYPASLSENIQILRLPEKYELRQTITEREFLSALDPVFYISIDNAAIYLRNLTSFNTFEADLSGSTNITYGYPLIEDAPLEVKLGTVTYIYSPDTADPASGTLTVDTSGRCVVRWPDKNELSNIGTTIGISINGGPTVYPQAIDFWNSFDEFGVLTGIKRIDGEDNLSFRDRILTCYNAPANSTKAGMLNGISRELAKIKMLTGWTGETTLDLLASGYTDISSVYIRDLKSKLYIKNEELYRDPASGFDVWYSRKRSWLPGYIVYVDGNIKESSTYTLADVSGFGTKLTFTSPIGSGSIVEAEYCVNTYTLETSGEYIAKIVPVVGNIIPSKFSVTLISGIRINTLTDPVFQSTLTTEKKTPTPEFIDIANRIQSEVPVSWGNAVWSKNTYLFSEEEVKPKVGYLPTHFDTNLL